MKRLTEPNHGVKLDVILIGIKRKMRGWIQHYSIGKLKRFLDQSR
ncbi:hypothetical protein [Lactobacillus sp. ESL0791]